MDQGLPWPERIHSTGLKHGHGYGVFLELFPQQSSLYNNFTRTAVVTVTHAQLCVGALQDQLNFFNYASR